MKGWVPPLTSERRMPVSKGDRHSAKLSRCDRLVQSSGRRVSFPNCGGKRVSTRAHNHPVDAGGSPGFARSPALSPSHKALGGWAWRIFVQFSSLVLHICVFMRRAITSGSASQSTSSQTCGTILSIQTNWGWAPLALRHTRGRISSPAGLAWHMSCTEP